MASSDTLGKSLMNPGPLMGRVIALSMASIALLAINQTADSVLRLAFGEYRSPLPPIVGLGMFVVVATAYILFLRRFSNITHMIAYLIVIALFLPVIFISVGFIAITTTDVSSFLFYDETCKQSAAICGPAFAFSVYTEAIRLLPSVILAPLVYLYSLRIMKVQTYLHKPDGPAPPQVIHHLQRTDISAQLLLDAPQDTLNSGIVYSSLVTLVATLLAMEDLPTRLAFTYGLCAISFTLLVTITGQYILRGKTRPRYKMLTYQVMMVAFDLVLAIAPFIVLLSIQTGQDAPNTATTSAIVSFFAFVSLPISTRLLAPMLIGKTLIFAFCALFIILQQDFPFGSATLVILQIVSLLLISALGYYFHIRNMGELKLRVALAELQSETAAQNELLEKTVKTEKRTARRLEGEMELRRRLMRFVGHDFRQPINAISLMVFRMKRDKVSEQTAKILEKCDDCVKSANGMIESLLDLSLLDHKGSQAEMRPVAAADILAGVRSEFETDAERRNVPLLIRDSSVEIVADSNILLRIMRNYVTNAMRYASDGRILVGVRRRGDMAEFQVVDEGPGITDEAKEKIFEEFFQNDPSMPAAGDGLGLGLAITRELARTINGQVTFDSQASKGSIFGIRVPLAEKKRLAKAKKITPVDADTLKQREQEKTGRILIIDDSQDFADSMAEVLRTLGQSVTVYTGPFEDLETIKQHLDSAELILLDYNLGNGLTGPDLVTSLNIKPSGPVHVVTAEPDPALLERLNTEGWRVLKKPVSGETLAAIIHPVFADA